MGYKNLCLDCRKTFNMGTDSEQIRQKDCPECNKPMILITHKFRPPKKSDDKKWQVVNLLIKHGFYYQRIYAKINNLNGVTSYENPVKYPDNMIDAKEFVEKYKLQGIINYQGKKE